MDCCSPNSAAQIVPDSTYEINQLEDRLAELLAQTSEYQEFIRLARLINLDPDVKRLSITIRNNQMLHPDPDSAEIMALQAELETLPAVQAFRKVETAVKELFHTVDRVISAEAGVLFAPNAQQSGCG